MKKNKQMAHNKIPDDIIRAIYSGNTKHVINWMNNDNINNVDSDNRSIIFHAVISGLFDLVSLILSENVAINIKDKKGWYPIHYAVQGYFVEITALLIDKGAEIDVKDDFGNTPLWRAVFASQGRGEIIKLLLSKGADSKKENSSGISPLSLAEKISNYDIKQFF
ncbi:ankyrin repeat domain-containing protein [Mucilaginibacter sp. SJ]|uniref:ankyrin repeat domain-containing protein n=1 Tax=Mucilaginibacter sp. SJ TaxID=3029053 RepID=UPI0023A9FFF0|nr:ankyrin repeat domain-containing protein [Mucilaginibacter sp. SJ]WEA00359.1 ankyrin repeat domain-containing protein [Mucilaginibacter sp. SJ]